MVADFYKHVLVFKQASGTSRGVLKTKETWILRITEGQKTGRGECGMFRGLSIDDTPDFEDKLKWTCDNINLGLEKLLQSLDKFPSIQFGLEMAFRSLGQDSPFMLFPSKFTAHKAAIDINGLIWMGTKDFMKKQIKDKIKKGFRCIKMKIGAIDFETELDLIKHIRKEYTPDDIELRVDANGAFEPKHALEKLNRLAEYQLHSIEQPIKQGQIDDMAGLCAQTPLPIALDEELIGVSDESKKLELLRRIKPQYIILKPTLLGGFKASLEWINAAQSLNIGWWITSALESNIGLNAIAQWTYTLKSKMPQGLGTGSLFQNNFSSPLYVKQGRLYHNNSESWSVKY
jgi:o-succinylbenzoate synthase